jgi:hypothetical protein
MVYPFSCKAESINIRNLIYNSFDCRNDLSMELLDALSSDIKVDSPIELSQSHHFTRKHSSISQLVTQFLTEEALSEILKNIAESIRVHLDLFDSSQSKIRYFALDETGIFKPCAVAMNDKGYVHGCSKTNSSIGVGHSYSYLVGLSPILGSWVIPIDLKRVATSDSGITLGLKQFTSHVATQDKNETFVLTADSKYSTKESVNEIYATESDTLLLTRLNSVRNLYFPYTGEQKRYGMDKEYGDVFKLHDESTWAKPDDKTEFKIVSKRGKKYLVTLTKWKKLIMSGSNEIKMHDKYFDIVRVVITNEAGDPVYRKGMWLMLAGENRHLLNMKDIFEKYADRFKIEHFFRFCKQRLLLGKYQTPDTPTQNKWCEFTALSYLNLLSCSGLTNTDLLKPWQKGMQNPKGISSPSQTKRMFSSIVSEIGTPAKPCVYVPHGKGRKIGTELEKRGAKPVIKKSKSGHISILSDTEKKTKKSESEKIKKPTDGLRNKAVNNPYQILIDFGMIEKAG